MYEKLVESLVPHGFPTGCFSNLSGNTSVVVESYIEERLRKIKTCV